MTTPCIIAVAITGSLPKKKDNPAVPISVTKQIESTHESFDAGAALVHLHVRNDDESPTSQAAGHGGGGTQPASPAGRRVRPARPRSNGRRTPACASP
jgi:hypothetical protein